MDIGAAVAQGEEFESQCSPILCQSVLGQNTLDGCASSERCVIEKVLHRDALYECVCEWVKGKSTVKRFEWSSKEKVYEYKPFTISLGICLNPERAAFTKKGTLDLEMICVCVFLYFIVIGLWGHFVRSSFSKCRQRVAFRVWVRIRLKPAGADWYVSQCLRFELGDMADGKYMEIKK